MRPNPAAPGWSKFMTMTRMKVHFAAAAATCMVAASATAQIYRCTEGETTVFSDIPCSESAELHESAGGISVVKAPEGLDEIAAGNRIFLEQRQEQLAQQRERAEQRRLQAQQEARRSEAAAEALRYRTVIGHLGDPRFAPHRRSQLDPRTRAQRDRQTGDEDPARRRSLLRRSGGDQGSIPR